LQKPIKSSKPSPDLPEGCTARGNELLGDAVVLADHLLTIEPAAVLSAMGGKATAKRGSQYYPEAQDEGWRYGRKSDQSFFPKTLDAIIILIYPS
jgi:hypothetical protein